MTHADLVAAAAKWLKNVWRCPVLTTEMSEHGQKVDRNPLAP